MATTGHTQELLEQSRGMEWILLTTMMKRKEEEFEFERKGHWMEIRIRKIRGTSLIQPGGTFQMPRIILQQFFWGWVGKVLTVQLTTVLYLTNPPVLEFPLTEIN